MESFSFLKYWRGGTGGSTSAANIPPSDAIKLPEPATDDEQTDEEGPFFDLEFAAPEDRVAEDEQDENALLEDEEDDKDSNFSMNSSGGNELPTISSSDELFFKGELVPLESSSIVIAAGDSDPKTQLSVSFLKSATKFRVFILGRRKSKSTTVESNAAGFSSKQSQLPSKFFFIKFKVEEVPIVSLFTRDSSSRNQACDPKAMEKITDIDDGEDAAIAAATAAAEEKTKSSNSKEVVHKYLSKIKPLYVRVSKRYVEKLKFSGLLVHGGVPATELCSQEEKEAEAEAEKPAEVKITEKSSKMAMPAKLKVVYERLGKSRSATVPAVSSPPPQRRRDDSLIEQQDGIQSAIAHCKRSFTATSKEKESPSQLLESCPEAGRM
ncbi:probable membrane-associated kinase regulator 2 [Phalaenopsis equestris]|uniref:probable membrane-associated kinase regulator 2 n=1 Tax=Phalaenopsis equestris TaxID=78828 RepID=UPI0009E5FD4F|nr:probable membrane-associated kinase regulator 2 [Phalaenopsis equestris]